MIFVGIFKKSVRADEGDKADGDDGADRTDVTAIYIVICLEHHGNRLYGVMGLLGKKSDGWSGVDLDCYDY